MKFILAWYESMCERKEMQIIHKFCCSLVLYSVFTCRILSALNECYFQSLAITTLYNPMLLATHKKKTQILFKFFISKSASDP